MLSAIKWFLLHVTWLFLLWLSLWSPLQLNRLYLTELSDDINSDLGCFPFLLSVKLPLDWKLYPSNQECPGDGFEQAWNYPIRMSCLGQLYWAATWLPLGFYFLFFPTVINYIFQWRGFFFFLISVPRSATKQEIIEDMETKFSIF